MPTGDASIYVVERGWHTDIGLPVDEIAGPLATLERGFPGVRFVVFGFGERAYYMARRTGSAELLTAMFPSKSAILMTALSASPIEAFADQHVVELHLPQDAVDRIANRISQVLEKARTAQRFAWLMALIPAASSLLQPKRTTCSTRATHGQRHCCTTRACPSIRRCCWPIRLCSRWIGLRSCRRGRGVDQQGGALPLGHTTVVPGGKTTVVPDAGGGGLLLLKLRHPASNNGRSNAIRRQHMAVFLVTSRGFARTRYQVGRGSARANHYRAGN